MKRGRRMVGFVAGYWSVAVVGHTFDPGEMKPVLTPRHHRLDPRLDRASRDFAIEDLIIELTFDVDRPTANRVLAPSR